MLQAYPSLTETEFLEACGALERRCHDRLSGSDWLSVKYTGRELQIIQSRSKPKKSHSDKFSARAEGTKGGELDAENEIDDGEKDEQDDEASVCEDSVGDSLFVLLRADGESFDDSHLATSCRYHSR